MVHITCGWRISSLTRDIRRSVGTGAGGRWRALDGQLPHRRRRQHPGWTPGPLWDREGVLASFDRTGIDASKCDRWGVDEAFHEVRMSLPIENSRYSSPPEVSRIPSPSPYLSRSQGLPRSPGFLDTARPTPLTHRYTPGMK